MTSPGLAGHGSELADAVIERPARRPLDRLVLALALSALTAVSLYAFLDTESAVRLSASAARAARHLSRGLLAVAAVAAGLGMDLGLLLVTVSAARRRRRSLWTALGAAVVTALLIGPLTAWAHAYGGSGWTALLGESEESAVVPTAVIGAYLCAVDVTRLGRWSAYVPPALAAVVFTAVGRGALTPISATVSVAAGVSIGYAARLVAGVNAARPPMTAVLRALGSQGLELRTLRHKARATGLSTYLGVLADGTELDVIVIDRDRRGFGLTTRLWRQIRVTTPALGHPPLTVRGQLERQGLALVEAARAGITAPRLVALLAVGGGAVVLARTRLEGTPLGPETPPTVLADAFRQLRRLHRHGTAHGDVNLDTVLAVPCGAAFTGWTRTEVATGELLRRLDVTHLLVSAGIATDAATAVAAYRRGYATDDAALLPLLQRGALGGRLRGSLKAAPEILATLRAELSATVTPVAAAVEASPAERLERFRARTVFTVVAGTVAGYLLLTQLSRVNLLATLQQARPGWILTAAAASAVTYLGAALSLMAFASVRLRLWRTAAVQLASSFLGLVAPAAASHVALNLRYLQVNGMNVPAATTVIGLGQVVGFTVSASLLVVFSALTGQSVRGASFLPSGEIFAVLAGSVVVIGLLTFIPRVRRALLEQLLPQLRLAISPMQELLSQPRRLLGALGGNLLLTGGYVAALDASLRAVGAPLALPTVVVVFLAGTVVGSAAPTPGGIGAVEAAMTAALTTVAVSTASALPAVLLFRLVTFWVPVPLGWAAFTVLERRGVV